ncbi:MAG: 30S ribosomal protein S3 [Patescibacteria group bacterium]|nr:30S ribosomal protein S3 [Patescibacteria group bacterium]MCL5093977.1 30S ribosomal protein S3 [Patescibacteria group bacterium]
MGRKTNPISFRTLVTGKWKSQWIAKDADYANFLIEDIKIRKEINDSLGVKGGVADIEIERGANEVKIYIKTSRPGMIIGRGGTGAIDLKNKLQKLVKSKIKDISIEEIKDVDLNAKLVADSIASQLEKRIAFRRAINQATERVLKAGAKGVKIKVSGRLNGAEIARNEFVYKGTIPLQTIKADVDYAYSRAKTTYGIIGVKVWIYQGKEIEKKFEIKEPIESITKGRK